MYVNNIAVAQ